MILRSSEGLRTSLFFGGLPVDVLVDTPDAGTLISHKR